MKSSAPLSDAERAFKRALILLRRTEFEIALSYLDDACHLDPQSMLYRAWRAYAAYLCGRCTEGAVLRLVHTYTLMESSDTPQLMLLLGHIRRRTGRLEKARYWYERAAELDADDVYIQRALLEVGRAELPEQPQPRAGLWQTVRSWFGA